VAELPRDMLVVPTVRELLTSAPFGILVKPAPEPEWAPVILVNKAVEPVIVDPDIVVNLAVEPVTVEPDMVVNLAVEPVTVEPVTVVNSANEPVVVEPVNTVTVKPLIVELVT